MGAGIGRPLPRLRADPTVTPSPNPVPGPGINPARARLERGDTALGVGLRLARTVEFAPLMANCGYDWLFIDLEHSAMSLDTAADISVVALGAGIAPLARVPAADYSMAARILDCGAWGVLMSHVETAEQARETVARLKFPPVGHRSVSYSMPQLGFQPMRQADATRLLNEQMLLVAMIESPAGIANARDIAAVPGIDALFIGTNDLAMDMGVPEAFGDPRIVAAYDAVIAACRVHGKWPAMGGVYGEELLRRYIGMGMRMVLGGTDMGLLTESARQRAEMIRGVRAGSDPALTPP